MAIARTPVVIAGAGPTGLALAIELGQRGVACLVVERNDRVGYAPRAKTTHTRTREHLRRWGIADRLAEASPFGIDYPSNVVFVTRLAGPELARFENAFNCAPDPDPQYAEHAQWIPQYKLEEVLRAHAETLPGVQLRFNCEFEAAEQDGDGVVSRFTDVLTKEPFEVRSDFLVGADGARSKTRDLIGAALQGVYGLSRNYNIVFRAPGLAQAHAHGPAIMYWQVNGDAPSLIGPMDTGDRWFFMPTGVAHDLQLTDAEAAALIARATGIDLAYEILSRDEWTASQFIADRYRLGRIFLAGDACHLHPPFGGYGMNMGIADAVDLGWKLAAVLKGWGGEGLLASYEPERRDVHEQVIAEAVANHALLTNQLLRPDLEVDSAAGALQRSEVGEIIRTAKRREFRSLGVVLGYCYAHSPIIAYGGETPGPSDPLTYIPSAAPGRRAPHAWLDDGQSLYDLFGPDLTLLVLDTAMGPAVHRAQADARAAALSMRVLELQDPVLALLYEAPLALVRPDQHVAWRGSEWPGPGLLAKVTGRAPGQADNASPMGEGPGASESVSGALRP